jgi:hypothetical protein
LGPQNEDEFETLPEVRAKLKITTIARATLSYLDPFDSAFPKNCHRTEMHNSVSTQAKLLNLVTSLGLNDADVKLTLAKLEHALHESQVECAARQFTIDNSNYLLNNQIPGLITGRKGDGNITATEATNKCNRLKTVFNLLKGNSEQGQLRTIREEDQADFCTGCFVQNIDGIEKALYTAYSHVDTRIQFLDTCRYLCRLKLCCAEGDAVSLYSKLIKQYETLISKIRFAPVDHAHKGSNDGKRTRDMYSTLSQEDARVHIQEVRMGAKEIFKFLKPKLQSLQEKLSGLSREQKAKKLAIALSSQHTLDTSFDANHSGTLLDDQGKACTKKLGTWLQDYIMLAMKHGIKHTDELRALRTGDFRNLRYATPTTAIGAGTWIVVHPDRSVYLHVISTKIGAPVKIPLHERCARLKKFLRKTWWPMMKLYQATKTPLVFCTVTTNATNRLQLSEDATQKRNSRAFLACQIHGTQNLSRHADAVSKRFRVDRPTEAAHNAGQDVNYRNHCAGGSTGESP